MNGAVYSIQHFLAASGLVYYRLRTMNTDGTSEYSPIVTTTWDKQINGAVIPGIVRNNRMVITLYEPFTQLRLVTPAGQTLFSRNIQGMSGLNEINLPSLPEGVYIIHLQGKERQYSKQLVITR